MGVTEDQLHDLARYQESTAFSEQERLALDLAVAMSSVPVEVSPGLHAALRRHFTTTQFVELTAAIAWENYRSRFNRVFNIQPVGFSAGAFCALPEHQPTQP